MSRYTGHKLQEIYRRICHRFLEHGITKYVKMYRNMQATQA